MGYAHSAALLSKVSLSLPLAGSDRETLEISKLALSVKNCVSGRVVPPGEAGPRSRGGSDWVPGSPRPLKTVPTEGTPSDAGSRELHGLQVPESLWRAGSGKSWWLGRRLAK